MGVCLEGCLARVLGRGDGREMNIGDGAVEGWFGAGVFGTEEAIHVGVL